MEIFKSLALYFLLLCFTTTSSSSLDMITPSQPMRDEQNETLVSTGEIFMAGFFSSENSNSRYLGIWYKNIPERTIVWVANREKPLPDKSGVLKIDSDTGILSIFNSKGVETWSSNASKKAVKMKPIVQLLDSGNLVVRDENEGILWQSFDYPGDTFLPGMKIGSNLRTGQYMALTSWKTKQDPTPGDYSLKIDTHGFPQLIVTQGSAIKFRAGSWNGLGFTGTPELRAIKSVKFLFDLSKDEIFYEYKLLNSSTLTRSRLMSEGYPVRLIWSPRESRWDVFYPSQYDQCESYATCGANTNCNVKNGSLICECLTGFKEDKLVGSSGCVRTTPLGCNKGDSFQKYEGMKLPDTSSSWYSKTMDLKECQESCLKNCSCTAYANLDIQNGGSGCLLWFDSVIDMRQLLQGGQELYIRVSASELVSKSRNEPGQKVLYIIIIPILFVILLTLALFAYYYRKRKLKGKGEDLLLFDVGMSMKVNSSELTDLEKTAKVNKREVKLPLFSLASVSAATDNYSAANKLGEGGFGPVYKGKLLNGDEVAVKRLSTRSGQGWEELKNEALLIAKLQHNNLVRLLGCCIERDEKMLIYEFMPNKSLDFFLFDAKKSRTLNWETRVRIIDGIAQGLLYLHQYSRFRIIHRDLKASNVLLDINMNPKISDFGMARIFGGNELQANTNRIVGTYGYMSPEYAMEGLFSIKFDVFSFGVLLLEIISGKKNTGFYNSNSLNLLGYAWDLWTSGRGVELMDSLVEDASINKMEVLRYVNIALLCVQESAAERPTMADVVSLLGNDNAVLPYPKSIAFSNVRGIRNSRCDASSVENVSINAMTTSVMEAR